LALAEAGLAMKQGDQDLNVAWPGWPVDDFNPAGWQMVHRDLKPGNVFLGSATATHFPDYPSIKVSPHHLVQT